MEPYQHTPEGGPQHDWRVTAYVFGQLEGDQRSEFEQLVASDAEYQQAVAETRLLLGALEQDAAQQEAAIGGLSYDRQEHVAAAIAAQADSGGRGQRGLGDRLVDLPTPSAATSSHSRLLFAAVAASVVGLMVATYAIYSKPRFQVVSMVPEASQLSQEEDLVGELDHQEAEETRQFGEQAEDVVETPAGPPVSSQMVVGNESPQPQPTDTEKLEQASAPVDARAVKPAGSGATVASAPVDSGKQSRPIQTGDMLLTKPAEPQSPATEVTPAMSTAGINGPQETATLGPVTGPASARGVDPFEAAGGSRAPIQEDAFGVADRGGYSGQARTGYSEGYGAAAGSGYVENPAGYPLARRSRAEGEQVESVPSLALEKSDAAEPYGPNQSRFSLRDLPSHMRRPQAGGDAYAAIVDNPFRQVSASPLSTFSIDVDTASYSKVRMMLTQYHRLPPADAVRIEEFINYFDYHYAGPDDNEAPFSAAMEVATCPWDESHRLARIAIKGREVANQERKVSNLVFLLDVSGSMNEPNKLPLLRNALEMLVRELGENDRVAIVVYAGAAGMVLDSTTADHQEDILQALDRLQAGGSTNGGQGIQLAYQVARDHFIPAGTNRVILCTDGDFNVGTTGTEQLVSLVEKEAKGGVFLTVLGFGTGNLNDAMLEAISGRGDGNYAFIDDLREARKVLVEQLSGTLETIAKNVKIQIEFNPRKVQSYRLIGYENRVMAAEDFNDDSKDAGEIGAGHTVTALYELVPVESVSQAGSQLRYQPAETTEELPAETGVHDDELLALNLRYMLPTENESRLLVFPIKDEVRPFAEASNDFRFAASVAGFGMLLRHSPHSGGATYDSVRKIARDAIAEDPHGLRAEFVSLVDAAKRLDVGR